MEECIFCDMKNISKDGIVYQNKKCYVVLDKFPVTKGHLLVIPRKHYKDMLETPKPVIEDMYDVAKNAALALKKKLKPDGFNITTNIGKVAGQFVMHFHIHVIPRYKKDHKEAKYEFDHHHQLPDKLEKELQTILKW
jgi:diadenosine tetraphosphate (Ap4A) HIT family hydrolase